MPHIMYPTLCPCRRWFRRGLAYAASILALMVCYRVVESHHDRTYTAVAGTCASRKVFIVHGRDDLLVARFRDLLRSVGLEPLEWEPLVRATRTTAPFLGDVVAAAPRLAQATLVLLSPDDIVELHPELSLGNDRQAERARSMQARPNVYYEFGLAMMACPERTVVVEVGDMRQAGDLAGRNVIRFTNSLAAVNKVLDRLEQAGCPVNRSGNDWMDPGRFDGLAAYQRGPVGP
jgi:predicted nucleotide-binding protein